MNALFRSKNRRGKQGERKVSRQLHRLPGRWYVVLEDLMLLTGNTLTQIDHVVVSVYGIFVLETKNYRGKICGTERGENWRQVIGGKKYPFRNPFRQNYAHIQALKDLLGLEDDSCFISMAVFSDEAELCVETDQELLPISQVRRNIRKYRRMQFAWEDVQYMAGCILCANLDSKEARQQHLSQIENEIAYRHFAERHGLCPRCGGQLVRRTGREGDFWGCENFPQCRYTCSMETDES